jgi:long-chain fatty acid transport protein
MRNADWSHLMFCRSILLCLVLNLLAAPSWGSGFGVFTQGAEGLGQANAIIAHATGPSSLYFNPALLPQLAGTQVEVGTTMVKPGREFTSTLTGLGTDSRESAQFPSSAYLTHSYRNGLAAGIGVFFPFGLTTEWSDNWDGRYIATKSELFTTAINPVIAWQATPGIALAAGLDIMYLDAKLQNQINTTAVGFIANPPGGLGLLTDTGQTFSGDDWGVGFNLAAHLRILDNLAFGATYRSKVEMTAEGSASFAVPADAAALGLGTLFPTTRGFADITLPAQFAFGLAWEPTAALTLETGARWEGWSDFHELRLQFATPILGQTSFVTPRDWDDTWAFNVGGAYQLNRIVTLLAGYLYSENPVPDSSFDPSIPDSAAHLVTLGTSLNFEPWSVALAYGYEHHQDRNKHNLVGDPLDPVGLNPLSTANGEYTTNLHLLAVSLGYRF